MLSQSELESEAISGKNEKYHLLLLIPILIEIAYFCDLDWPTILMKGNTLERLGRRGLG